MKQLTIVLLFLASILQGQTGAAYWHGSTDPGVITPEPDTLTLTYWSDFILLHIANTGITEDVNGVSQWQDRSGNGNHSTQTVDTNKPTVDGSGNVVFDGVNDFLDGVTLWASGADSSYTYFVVFETGSTIPNNRIMPYTYEQYDGSSDLANFFWVAVDSSSVSDGDLWFASRDVVSPVTEWRKENLSSISTNTKYLTCMAASETVDADYRANGVALDSLSSDGDWYGDNFIPSVGSVRGTGNFWNGKILFIGVAGRKFTSAEIATTESELNSFFTIY